MVQETASNTKRSRLIRSGISFLTWASPFLGLGPFFPLGVWILYGKDRVLLRASFASLCLQAIIYSIFFPFELLTLYNEEYRNLLGAWISENIWYLELGLFILGILVVAGQVSYLKKKFTPEHFPQIKILRPIYRIAVPIISILLVEFVALDDSFQFLYMPVHQLSLTFLYFLVTAVGLTVGWSGQKIFFLFARPYQFFLKQKRLLRVDEFYPNRWGVQKKKWILRRDWILTGWGHIFQGDNWRGFSLLFLNLLLLLFLAVSCFSWIDPIFGVSYLASLGLKPGIAETQFYRFLANGYSVVIVLGFLIGLSLFSKYLLYRSFQNPSPERRRLGLTNNLSYSVLLHLVLLTLILLIPITLQRKTAQEKKNSLANESDSERMEFYFIDPDLPDQIEGLNGNVLSGSETPKKPGEVVEKREKSEEGKVEGEVKKSKGKKLPATYSNYISAKMRGPEFFMEYWKNAPKPYSCVVSYTITQDGEIVDVKLVEGSSYPQQDQLTLELVRSMAPLLPPPNSTGNVRVTELFWNGTLDPNAMPTELQKELVTMFDGRYMEEL